MEQITQEKNIVFYPEGILLRRINAPKKMVQLIY